MEVNCHHVYNVWTSDARGHFNVISDLLSEYSYIAIAVKHPINIGNTKELVHTYDTMKTNVNRYPPIQIALTCFDSTGKASVTWQFNMKLENDSKAITDQLVNSGFNFDSNRRKGIQHNIMSEQLVSNRIVLVKNVTWLSFNGAYDFGYLVKILTGRCLPDNEIQFLEAVRLYTRKMFDVRYLMNACKNLSGTLDDMATRFNIARLQPRFYSASDSKLLGTIFFKIKERYFQNRIDDSYFGHIQSLNTLELPRCHHKKKKDCHKYRASLKQQ